MIDSNNYPCKCGHSKISHDDAVCFGCYDARAYGSMHSFVADNLRYLEQKYEQKILNKYKKLETKEI